MPTRFINFAGSTLALEYSGPRAARIIEFLYRHIPDESNTPSHLTYRLVTCDKSDRMILYRGNTLIYEGHSEADLASLLLGDTCYHLANQSQGGLLFHAAGLAWRGKGLILPGVIGAGKSTLAAWLLTKGFDYLTDELVFVPQGSDTFQAFTRPLNLKAPARSVLQRQFDFGGQSHFILNGPQFDLIPPTVFNPANKLSEPPLSLIIFPRYLPEGDFELRSLTKAQTGFELMHCLVNARNLPEHGFPEVTRLAKMVPAYKMTYANFGQIGEDVETLLTATS